MTPYPKSMVRDYFETIAVCVIFVLFSRAFVFQQSKIPTGSMKDTLLIGDYIMVNKFVYGPAASSWEQALLPMAPLRRGDVVVFKFPQEPETDYIKRVIGLPGEEVELVNGVVYIDGVPLAEPYVKHVEPPDRRPADNWGPRVVPPDQYLCLGDNRDQSADSRMWGFVPRSFMKGRALLIWYSFEEDPDAYRKTALFQRVAAIANKIIHFFDDTRWSRMFDVIR